MAGRRLEGNRPDRRVAPEEFTPEASRTDLLDRARYVGSGVHKLTPGNYGFVPTHNPRPTKSVCDDVRQVPLEEASNLFRAGIARGMVSRFDEGGFPKYVWSVDDADEVYEAKTKPGREDEYHGYRVSDDEKLMRQYILSEWRRRDERG